MNILVTGSKGRLVTYFRNYVKNNKHDWTFRFVSLRTNDWRKIDFSNFDAVIHCAGITSALNDDYEEFHKVNVVKTRELFTKVVSQQGRHFVYLSSMAVYDGIGWGFGKEGLITQETKPKQKTNYGKSKFKAEEEIRKIDYKSTKVSIIRAPAIVGGGLEAYFDRYIQFSKIPIIPIPMIHIEAKRSFVYIDTLIEHLCNIVECGLDGIFFPQNFPQLSVSEIMYEVCKFRGVNKRFWKSAECYFPKAIQKRFFSQICYDESLSLKEMTRFRYIKSEEVIRRTI